MSSAAVTANPKRFMPLGPLLSGGGSRAFLGIEARPEGPRAVVFIWVPDEVVRDSDRLARLKRDTDQASRLDHPNIIQVVGLERLDEGPARVVTFADGESLRHTLEMAKAAGRQLPPELGARVIADACFGVHYAHELGEAEDGRPLVHGDLRPEMLMVSFDGTTKVTGYGALEVAPKPEDGAISSRQIYQSPEQVAGGHTAAGRAADVYALGVILYEALSGRPPFVDSEPDLELAILTKEPPRVTLVTAPEGLADVALKAMSKKATDRYPTALALREAIEASFGGTAPTSEDVAKFLAEVFPPSSREREARRQLLQSVMSASGMHVIPEGEALPPPPSEAPAPPPAAVPRERAAPEVPIAVSPPAAPAAARPAPVEERPAPAAAIPSARRTVTEPEIRREPFNVTRILLLALLVVAIAGPIWLRSQRTPGVRAPEPGVVRVHPVPAPPPSEKEAPAPRPEPVAAPPPKKAAPEGPKTGTLELDSDPAGELFVDGKSVGRGKARVTVPTGRHSIRLVDKGKGIDVGRSVTVGAGKRIEEHLSVGSATLTLTAPDGAEVFLDGRKIGKAPVQPLTFYEGPHRIQITYKGAKMEKRFNARAGEALTLDVKPTP